MPTIEPLQIGKLKVARGLQWVPLPGEDGQAPSKEFKALVVAQEQRFAVLYESAASRYQLAGWPSDMDPDIVGQVPAAIWLAESVTRPTLYIEAQDAARSHYWLLYISKPGVIDSRTDCVLTDDDTASLLDQILDEVGGGSSDAIDVVIGGSGAYPSTHMIERTRRRIGQFRELLSEEVPSQRIRQVIGLTKTTKRLLGAVVVCVVLAVGVVLGVKHLRVMQSEAARAAADARAQAEAARMAALTAERSAQAVADALAQDTATPPPSLLVAACTQSATDYPLLLGGWHLAEFTCAPGTTPVATYQRDTGPIDGLATQETLYRAAAARGLSMHAEFLADTAMVTGRQIALTARAPMVPKQLPPADVYGRALSSRIQRMKGLVEGVSAAFAAPVPRSISFDSPAAPGIAVTVPEGEGYRIGTITLTGDQLWSLPLIPLDDPALTINQVKFRSNNGLMAWTVEAKYVVRNG